MSPVALGGRLLGVERNGEFTSANTAPIPVGRLWTGRRRAHPGYAEPPKDLKRCGLLACWYTIGPPVLSPSQRRALRAFADRLVPTDEHGPGAVPAGALGYVEQALAGDYAAFLPAYVAGLEALDAATMTRDGRPFPDLDPDTQDARLREIEGGAFFELVRRHVIEGMFGDPVHGGNRDRAGWELLGYTGPQRAWTAEEQRIREAGA